MRIVCSVLERTGHASAPRPLLPCSLRWPSARAATAQAPRCTCRGGTQHEGRCTRRGAVCSERACGRERPARENGPRASAVHRAEASASSVARRAAHRRAAVPVARMHRCCPRPLACLLVPGVAPSTARVPPSPVTRNRHCLRRTRVGATRSTVAPACLPDTAPRGRVRARAAPLLPPPARNASTPRRRRARALRRGELPPPSAACCLPPRSSPPRTSVVRLRAWPSTQMHEHCSLDAALHSRRLPAVPANG